MSDASTRPGRLRAGLANPGKALRVVVSLLRGHWYKAWYPLRGIRFRAGRNFRAEGRLVLRGPGQVIFGDDVTIGMRVTPWTYDSGAVITIGNRCYLNGTRMGCARRITVGDFGILAECHILDTNLHSTARDRHAPGAPVRVAPVVLARNVWVAANAGILAGTTVGENSVVGFGAVCSGDYPADVLIAGNPARVVRSLLDTPESAPAHSES